MSKASWDHIVIPKQLQLDSWGSGASKKCNIYTGWGKKISLICRCRCCSAGVEGMFEVTLLYFPGCAISVDSMSWTSKLRAFVVETYFKNADSIIETQRLFRRHFGVSRHGKIPDRKTISLWVANFRETGSCLKRKSPGRPRHVRTLENVAAARDAVTKSPRRSACKQASALGLSQRSLRRILHEDLKFHPNKMMLVQEMKECNWPNRKKCCEVLLENVVPDDVVLSSDEAHFHLSGCVNKQNFRYWAESNPRQKHERPLHTEHVTVWCAVSHLGAIDAYFFEENNETVTVNSQRYVHMLRSFVQPQLHQFGQSEVWFQQDGAIVQITNYFQIIHGIANTNVSKPPNMYSR
ncbi:hypothetical protein AVEN_56597-1 [Araneus ventricosus]|uniref:DUF4817 domain-containing protein n=1 Tax=Araneus ventricosus TaxID=182803 RepID=A0A4Y2RX03_ARAVE|nr:hypothetical protein AVEN_56597-1 [Araneus ventricosus]